LINIDVHSVRDSDLVEAVLNEVAEVLREGRT
jgi:hypothetical protein